MIAGSLVERCKVRVRGHVQWSALATALDDLHAAFGERKADLEYRWCSRVFNANADALSTAVILRQPVAWPTHVRELPGPPAGPPSRELLQDIEDAAASSGRCRSTRTMPPALVPLWHEARRCVA